MLVERILFRDMQRFTLNSAQFLVVRKNKQTDKQTNKQTFEARLCRQPAGPDSKIAYMVLHVLCPSLSLSSLLTGEQQTRHYHRCRPPTSWSKVAGSNPFLGLEVITIEKMRFQVLNYDNSAQSSCMNT